MNPVIELIVVGGGEGTHVKLASMIQADRPHLGMRIRTVVDVLEFNELHPRMQHLIKAQGIQYVRCENGIWSEPVQKSQMSAVIVMTPNDSHYRYAKWAVMNEKCPVFIEKPVATNVDDAEFLKRMGVENPFMVYGAEYCADGKALGLSLATGNLMPDDPRFQFFQISPNMEANEIFQRFQEIGELKRVNGRLLEGQGTAGTADHRAWLLEGHHGGMIRDLSSHLFSPILDARLVTGQVVDPRVQLFRHVPDTPPGKGSPLQSIAEGETYALMEGSFVTRTNKLVPFTLEVAKYWPRHDRKLRMLFERGTALLDYEPPYRFSFESGGATCSIDLLAEPYAMALLDFAQFFRQQRDGHMDRAVEIVRFNETMRAAGVAQMNLV
jgi:Oxidoreductase family, NAD-binding Rossmann fold